MKTATTRKTSSAHLISQLLHSTALTLTIGVFALSAPALAVDDLELPTGGTVVGGSAALNYTAPGQLDVNQATNRLVVDWDSFNIGSKATATFNQPTDTALAVNRVTGAGKDPTRILGTLKANGRVMVLDRNGVLFGVNSRVDAAGIIASTGDVDTAAVMAGSDRIELSNFGDATVENHGTISVADSGLAALVAPTVRNSGTITARLGRVALASGEKVTVDLYGDNLIEMALDGNASKAVIDQTGTIAAEGGVIQITAQAAKDVVDSAINMDGITTASSVTQNGGRIVLSGDTVNVGGTVSADGAAGGSVAVNARRTTVRNTARVTANSTAGQAAGTVKVLASEKATVAGTLEAKGATGTGFIETSAPDLAVADSTSVGTTGEWLIDPPDFVIDAVWEGLIETALGGGSVAILAPTGDIYVDRIIDWSTGHTLTLTAFNDILFGLASSGLNATGAGNATLNAGRNISLSAGSGISSNGGDITLNSQRFRLDSGTIDAHGGNIDINNSAGFQALANSIRTTGTGTISLNQNKDADPFLSINTIQNAVNAISNSGSGANTIDVGAGSFAEDVLLDRTLTLNGANAGIAVDGGRGAETTIAPTTTGLRVTADNVTVDGFSITGGTNAVNLDGSDATTIVNTIISSTSGDAVTGNAATNAVIDDNSISNAGGSGILLDNGSHNALIEDNIINTTGASAIKVVFSDASTIRNNAIGYTDRGVTSAGAYNISDDGILLLFASNGSGTRTTITGNQITDTLSTGLGYGSGVHAAFSHHVDIGGSGADANIISNADWDGVNVYNGSDINILDNEISNVVRSGVYLSDILGAVVERNNIDGTANWFGIDVATSDNVSVSENAINNTNLSGINLTSLTGTTIVNGNVIDNAGWHGIRSISNSDLQITNNSILRTDGDGILVRNSTNAGGTTTAISGNVIVGATTVAAPDGSGISVYSSNHVIAENNFVADTAWDGIRFYEGNDISANDNWVINADRSGMYFYRIDGVTAAGNIIDGTNSWYGIDASNSNAVSLLKNDISNTSLAGINLTDLTGATTVNGNTVTSPGTDGIASYGVAELELGDNTIDLAGNAGVHIRGPFYGQNTIYGNTVTDADTGMLFESGLIDLTGATNTINGGRLGYRFAPIMTRAGFTQVDLAGDTIGTTTFKGQSSFYVELVNGALFNPGTPTLEDGLNATYDGFSPAAFGGVLTALQLATLEGKFWHYNDDPTVGLFFFGSVPPVTVVSRAFRQDITGFTPGTGAAGFVITGLPNLPGNLPPPPPPSPDLTNPAALNALAPAAGPGAEGGELSANPTAEEVAAVEPAAGAADANCWSDAANLVGSGRPVSYSFATDPGAALADAASCGTNATP